ncbi:MAG: energy transducer TonB, partial [Saprospiraceae bacterium]
MKYQILLVFLLLNVSFVWANDLDSIPETVFVNADVLPVFQGCENVKKSKKSDCSDSNLMQFIMDNIQYPKEAESNGVDGVVVFRFTVNKTGNVETPEILRGIGHGCDEETIRVINLMPKWEAATRNGEPVAVSMTIPFRFKLNGNGVGKYQVQWGNLNGQTATRTQLNRATLEKVIARNSNGDEISLSGLKVEYEKGRKFKYAVSNG